MRHRAAQDEAARLDAGHLVDLVAGPWLHQFVDRAAKRPRVAEQRGDVAKQDSRLRIVRDGADGGLQVVFKSHGVSFKSMVIPEAAQRLSGISRFRVRSLRSRPGMTCALNQQSLNS